MIIQTSLTIYLLIILSILSACTGQDASPATISADNSNVIVTVTPSPEPETSIAEASTIPELSETYTGENELVNATLTVNYPSGWIAQGSGTQLQLVSENPETITANSEALIISIMPVEGDMLANLSDASAAALVAQAISDTTGQTVTANATTLNNREVAHARAGFEGNAAMLYAIQFDTEVFVLLSAIKSGDFTAENEALIAAIAETIDYDAGAIPQSNE